MNKQATTQFQMTHITNVTSIPVSSLPTQNEINANYPVNSNFAEQLDGKHSIDTEEIGTSWVDTDYGYDPNNPRKPNVRELVEALSGTSIEELYEQDTSVWQSYFVKASDMLYGTVSTVSDERDWQKIMASADIETAAASEFADVFEPYIDIESTFEQITLSHGSVENILTAQFPVIKSKDGNMISTNLSHNIKDLEDELGRFGGTKIALSRSVLSKVILSNFDFEKFKMIEDLTSEL